MGSRQICSFERVDIGVSISKPVLDLIIISRIRLQPVQFHMMSPESGIADKSIRLCQLNTGVENDLDSVDLVPERSDGDTGIRVSMES